MAIKKQHKVIKAKSIVSDDNIVSDMDPIAEETVKNKKQESLQEVNRSKKKGLSSLAEVICQDSLYYRNHAYPGAKQAFPNELKLQTVDKFFPYAEGGPIFIDEPAMMEKIEPYLEKEKLMKRLGHRYLLIKPGMDEMECREALV